jgi:SH3-like domain-containing protein
MALVASVNAYNPINLYESANARSNVVGTLAPGILVPIVEISDDGLWLKVGLDVVGWVTAQQVSLTGTLYTSPGTQTNRQGLIQSDSAVNVRSGPGTKYRALGPLRGGQVVQVLDQSADGQWVKVPYGRGVGWVAVSNVILAGGGPTATPIATEEVTREP